MKKAIQLAETGWVPDRLIRFGIRRLLRKRLQCLSGVRDSATAMAQKLSHGPLAVETAAANDQHYEVPSEFFATVLGPRLKYSCCFYDHPQAELARAEQRMLELTCSRAELEEGQQILELGCGWGALSLFMAENYPSASITAVSNSRTQREFIESQAAERGLENLRVVTADMRDFQAESKFDRIVSVEMFEHMRNYRLLLERVSGWLLPGGKLFVHIFCHRLNTYLFEDEGDEDWMARHFFSGGTMPSQDLLPNFSDHLKVGRQWRVPGEHYARTCEHWLRRADQNRGILLKLFSKSSESDDPRVILQRWRIFFMSCAELFNFARGTEWFVCHYLFEQAKYCDIEEAGKSQSVYVTAR